jgi:hypothetical protein
MGPAYAYAGWLDSVVEDLGLPNSTIAATRPPRLHTECAACSNNAHLERLHEGERLYEGNGLHGEI